MTNIDELCKILKAYAEGKTVQMKNKKGDWVDVPDFHKWQIGTPLQSNKQIRIKPEPREIWVVQYDGTLLHSVFEDQTRATEYVKGCNSKTNMAKFREVLDE
jgi:hypothetical protein